MGSINKILFADSAGPQMQKIYHQSHYVLAGLVPASLVSEKDSIFAKISDVGLAVAIPLHSQIGLNFGRQLHIITLLYVRVLASNSHLFAYQNLQS